MRISINISTEREIVYKQDNKQVLLHAKDEEKQNENFNYSFGGLDLNGSIQPLVDMILEWVKKQK